ncbi:TIGR04222 domain-containing membrane protein [Nonomuraea soli]|uniref:Putative membrane protein YgcG n=1 Tax=Nonomuraea soli TaxID=1032476 RepID=A0A7W0CQV3_9ACTN|nr:TIGR04222 domain-containing membrane protein [Nonomuraea soli]MBA2895656.1 putative membrane protein YgcG [Nonomuraea soli]
MDRNELAYLSGGRSRVALAALGELVLDGRIRVSRFGRLTPVAGAVGRDAVEMVALNQTNSLRSACGRVARDGAVRAIEPGLLARGLARKGWLGMGLRPTAEGKQLLKEARRLGGGPGVMIALNGLRGIPDSKVRKVFGRATSSSSGGFVHGGGDGGGCGGGGCGGGGCGGGSG